MAVSIAVTSSLHGLRAVLFVAALHIPVAAAEGTTKGADFVRVVPDHQLEVVKIESFAFLDQRSAIGVSAAVGFISLFGVSAMNGILLMSYIRRDIDEGMATEDAIIRAAETRMRQIFMTGLSACIGLFPAALSTGIGSQVQQLALVIVGGMLLSPICSLLVIPVLARSGCQ